MRTVIVIVVAGLLGLATGVSYKADEWVIARASTSHVCVIQLATSRPILGNMIGRYNSKDAAEKALKQLKQNGTCQ